MKRLIAVAGVAAALLPLSAPAFAQAPPDVRHDRQQVRQDNRDVRQDRQQVRQDRGAIRQDQGAVRQDRRDVRQDRADVRFDRNHPETWRSRPEWSGFHGARRGYWFAPGYGYRQVDPRWAGHVWRRNEVLPAPYRTLFVQSPAFYGLRPPPPGYRWVYYNNNFLLTAVASGLIADVVLNGY